MKIHEYQGKQLFAGYGVPILEGKVAFTVDDAVKAAEELGGSIWVVKAQIHAGGRGLGGGVKLARSIEEVKKHASDILGMQLITHQTGPEGQKVSRLYIESGADIAQEYYLGMVLDRETSQVVVMVSNEGGMEIEKVAAETPEKIFKEWVDPAVGLVGFQARKLAFALGLTGKTARGCASMLQALYKAYIDLDCSLVEINPMVVTKAGAVLALDAKVDFDDNGMFRHKNLMELRDLAEEAPSEIKAKEFGLSYIKLDGTVGCLVNGAGLAMATMDILKQFDCEPANFLDVGGSATEESVTEAFGILLGDNVDAIFINIFGGIMKCDTIANGVVAAAKNVGLSVPLIVRLAGTNVELGKQVLADSGLPIISADSMKDGAQKTAAAVKGA
ncbi:MAG: succinyl-CoA synthetase beta subunit [Myxococcota bacterium]|jgi:succinyl-CoA synthetase beta subunit